MEFQKIKVSADPKINKDTLVIMEALQRIREVAKSLAGMQRVLRLINEIKNSADSSKKPARREVIREAYVNDDPEEEVGDLVVLLSSDAGEVGDTTHKESDIMIWGETVAARINLLLLTAGLEPGNEVLDNSLVELVKNVRAD
jgi:hypothetical protein